MLLKRIVTGVIVAMMITGMSVADASAVNKANNAKSNYQSYAVNLDKTIYTGDDLGAVYTEKATVFKVWSPKATSVTVNIYENGSDAEGKDMLECKKLVLDKKTGVWSVKIFGNLENKYYTYTIKHGTTVKETADVYAKGCGVNGKRSMVVNPASTNPKGWENDKHILVSNPTQASVWEVSVADFSSSESSGVSPENRGKFTAFTEKGTTVNGIQGASSTCIDYIKKLGVKYVQIMPFYDFGSVDESKDINKQYNWGYDPVNYNCPEGSYSTNPKKGEVRIKECKQMIKALHDAGIGVIMDVVYNHTYSTESVFQNTVPDYYYRMNDDGTFSNGSGCGNDTASEHKMFRKYMIDSVTYWAKEYHIDGFRFDLMGLHDVTTMNSIRQALDNLYSDGSGQKIIMYGEAWDMPTRCDDGTVMANQKNLKQLSSRIGAFNDTIRDAIKGSTSGVDKGFVQEGSNRGSLKIGIAGQSDTSTGWAKTPMQCVTYASCHDNLCLYDKLVDSVIGKDSEYRKRYENLVNMNKLAGAITITSQGIPFMLAGEEFARSKDGDENSYSSSREENMIDWENIDKFSDIIEYYRGLLKIREAFSALSDCTAMTANNLSYLHDLPKGVSGYVVNNTETGKWKKLCVIFNGTDKEQTVSVNGDWTVLADDKTSGLRSIKTITNSVKVESHSAIIMTDTQSYNEAGIIDYEGLVTAEYYDNNTGKLLKKQTVSGEIGSAFDLSQMASTLNYDVKKTEGDARGVFTDQILKAKIYVEEYEGSISSVTFKFIDADNGKEIYDDYVIKNREGRQYFTPELPSIKNYSLIIEELPDNGAGTIQSEDITVIYKYSKTSSKNSECRVNAIYMDDTGKIVEINTIKGKKGEYYEIPENEYENMHIIEVPKTINGKLVDGEINVLINYSTTPDPIKAMLVYVYISVGIILALCVGSVVYSNIKKKRKYCENMDIEE